jgi:hypothetical protein
VLSELGVGSSDWLVVFRHVDVLELEPLRGEVPVTTVACTGGGVAPGTGTGGALASVAASRRSVGGTGDGAGPAAISRRIGP